MDEAVADSYGRLAAAVVRAGRRPPTRAMDLLIAASEHAHDAAVYTGLAADLAGREHLVDVVSP